MSFDNGPFVQAACLCDTVLREDNGTMSLIRIVDTITQNATGPSAPGEMLPFTHPLNLVLMIKSGRAVGRHEIKVIPEIPTGETKDPVLLTVHLDGEEKGYNLNMNLAFTYEHEGLYWFDVYFNDEKLTAIPLRVKYNRQVITSGSSGY